MAKKVLIIEDDKDYASLLEEALSLSGFNVSTIYKDGAILKVAKQSLPDLIILDILLPDTSGLLLLESLKNDEATKDISVICLTNLPDEVGRQKALEAGAHSYLTKADYSLSDIAKHVELYFKEEAKGSFHR